MTAIWVVGFDPGPTTGFALVTYIENADTDLVRGSWGAIGVQVKADLATDTWLGLLASVQRHPSDVAMVAGESFVARHRASRLRRAQDGTVTNTLATQLASIARELGWPVKLRRAVDVKAWASDKRLDAIGFRTRSPHAKDAARHALYRARFDAGTPDPLEAQLDREARP
jgi:hypothetical protein